MAAPTPVDAPSRAVVWTVAVLAFLYYLTPIAARLVAGRPLPWLLVAELVVPGLIALVGLWWRERRPLTIVLLVAALWLFSPTVLGAAVVMQEVIARKRGMGVALATGLLLFATKAVALLVPDTPGASSTALTFELTLAGAGLVIATLTGLLMSSRAQAAHDREAVERARLDAEMSRINEARMAERERIAREMHDVVAHRISLVAMHANALTYRTNLTPDEAREAARMIQVNAQSSLDELRTMLATLRGADAPPATPQPTLAELGVLVADAEDAGQHATLTRSGDLSAVPPQVSRQAFRIAQECLTNARKHAPGAPVQLAVTCTGEILRVRASNPLADLALPRVSAPGLGLVGIAERVSLVGGTVTHGVQQGQFVVDAVLPLGTHAKEDA